MFTKRKNRPLSWTLCTDTSHGIYITDATILMQIELIGITPAMLQYVATVKPHIDATKEQITDFPNEKALAFRLGMKVRSDKEHLLWCSNYLNFSMSFCCS